MDNQVPPYLSVIGYAIVIAFCWLIDFLRGK
jgi:hypothetical protein